MAPQRSPQNISITGPLRTAPSFTALPTVLSTFSVSRYKLVGDRLAVLTIHDPAFGKAECLLVEVGCRFHVGHRQHCRYGTVELFIERIDLFGHNTLLS